MPISSAAPNVSARSQSVRIGPRQFSIRLFAASAVDSAAQIAVLALEAGLPTMSQEESWAVAGGLISYGPTIADTFKRTAYFVDRLLKGAKPEDLPVEQATGFKLTVNLRTAKALRLTIPDSILQRADELIR